MKFFVIPPLAHNDLMSFGTAGYYCLAHLYMQNEEYRTFFNQKKMQGKYILLDNGAAESSLVGEDELLAIVQELKPNEVISPDTLFDGPKTHRALLSFIDGMGKIGALGFTKIFFCPQGSTQNEWIDSYRVGLNNPLVSTIGFSKIAVPMAFNNVAFGEDKMIMESRKEAFDLLSNQGMIQKPIHMLGAGDPREFSYYKDEPLIRSTDSAFSCVAAMNGHDWTKDEFIRVPTPHDYFSQTMGGHSASTLLNNISFLEDQTK
jgi:hypothetical protein